MSGYICGAGLIVGGEGEILLLHPTGGPSWTLWGGALPPLPLLTVDQSGLPPLIVFPCEPGDSQPVEPAEAVTTDRTTMSCFFIVPPFALLLVQHLAANAGAATAAHHCCCHGHSWTREPFVVRAR